MSTTLERPIEVDRDLDLSPGFRPDTTVTEEMKTWAASVLADLPTKVIYCANRRVQEGRGDDGMLYRRAFAICVTAGNRFAINLYSGASRDDLEHAEQLVDRAKRGWFNRDIWTPKTFRESGREGFILKCFWQWDGKPSIDGLRPCTMPGCLEDYHEYRNGEFNDVHRAEDIDTEFYLIQLRNYEDEDRWAPYISMDGDLPVGPKGLKILRDAANDFDWLQQQADKLNAAAAEVSAR